MPRPCRDLFPEAECFAKSADARTQNHTSAEGVFLGEVETGLVDRFDRGNDGELTEAIESLLFFRLDELFGVPIMNVAAEMDLEVRGIEQLQFMDATLTREDSLPQIFDLAA